MPSDLAITLGLLRFGALPASEKIRGLDDYQARSDSSGGGPHVWNPCVEVIESLWRDTDSYANDMGGDGVFKTEDRQLLGEIAAIARRLLENQPALVDRSAFHTPTGQQLSSLSGQAVTRLVSDTVEEMTFWDLMCHSCD